MNVPRSEAIPVCTSKPVEVRGLFMLLWSEPSRRGGHCRRWPFSWEIPVSLTLLIWWVSLALCSSFPKTGCLKLLGHLEQWDILIWSDAWIRMKNVPRYVEFFLSFWSQSFLGKKIHGVIAPTEKQDTLGKATSLKPILLTLFSIHFYQGWSCPCIVFQTMRKAGKIRVLTLRELAV